MQAETTVRFRVDPEMRRLLDRLRDEKDINVSAWVRRQLRRALEREFPGTAATVAQEAETEQQTPPIETPETPAPIETPAAPEPDPKKPPIRGWKPYKFQNGEWGAILEGETVAELPDNDQLIGTPIIVTPGKGGPWNATVSEVVSRDQFRIVVRRTSSR